MKIFQMKLSKTFKEFFEDQKSSGIILIVCTIISLIITNSPAGENYLKLWQFYLAGLSIEHWINDGLMAIFFLLIGLELKRELYRGELSNFKNALLPVFAAIGGIVFPALIHYSMNAGTATQAGMGIPMATDIAFALGALALLGSRVPASLKIFLTAFAVMDDLGAIIVIAVFYTAKLSIAYLVGALIVFGILLSLKNTRANWLVLYIIGGALMWFLMLKSGVHATIAGVLTAFTIPSSVVDDDETSLSDKLEHVLHKPTAFIILPIFALCNTGIVIGTGELRALANPNEFGIMSGLIVGKPIGITLISFLVVILGICRLPLDLNWRHIFGAGFLGGIGFTMSIFITNLAFAGNAAEINGSKMAILAASLAAGTSGLIWLMLFGGTAKSGENTEVLNFDEDEAEAILSE